MPKGKGQKGVMIEGMTEETARRYSEFRTKIDARLQYVGSLGNVIYYSGLSDDSDVDIMEVGNIGKLISEMIFEVLIDLDEMIYSIKVDSELEDLDMLISSVSVDDELTKFDKKEVCNA